MFKKIMTAILLCFALVCPLALTACKNNNSGNPITSISLNQVVKSEFYLGETFNVDGILITVAYKDGSTQQVALTNEMVNGFDTSTIGVKSCSISYGGKTISLPYTVRDIRATSIQLATPFKTTYYTNSQLNVDGGLLVAIFENGTTEEVTVTTDMISNFDTSTAGDKTMTITFRAATLTIDYTVVDAEVTNVSLNTRFTTEYFVGEDLNIENGTISVSYADGNNELVNISEDMVSNFNNETAGQKILTITYKGVSIEVPYQIKAITLSSMQLHTAFKTEYLEGEALDVTGGKLLLGFNNGTTQLIDITAEMVSGFNNTYVSPAAKMLTITYEGFITTLNYTIEEIVVTELTLTQKFKNTYYVGDAINIDGGLLTATYSDGSVTENIVVTAAMISGFNTSTAGEKTITITYEDFSITYDYTVVDVVITSIALTTNPTKTTYYVGDADYDLSGGIITIYYSNGTTSTVNTNDTTKIRFAGGFATNETGTGTITLSLKKTDFTVTFDYTVIETPVSE